MSRMLTGVAMACLVAGAFPAAAQTFPYDHIHLNVPDSVTAANWYAKNFGAKITSEGPDRTMIGSTRLLFLKKADAQPSTGSVIDHLGFSYADIDAKMKELAANGVKIVQPARDAGGAKLGFVEDPWGTRIEIVQDAATQGLHHIHLRAPDPEMVFSWLSAKFGGERTKLNGRIDAMKYSVSGFSPVLILVAQGDSMPSEGRAIDHIGWRSGAPLDQTIGKLRGQGVQILTEPRALAVGAGRSVNYSYVQGPAGAKIEIVERPGLKPGE